MCKFPDSLSWINPEKDRIIAATGAGGKTSCLEYLARQLKQLGHKVLLTTTTRIFRPSPAGFGQYIDRLIETDVLVQAGIEPKASSITLAGFPDENPEKLKGLSPTAIQHLISLNIYDNILIEADGSRQRPLKAPAINEPVLPDSCQVIIGVTGWTGICNPVTSQNIHRWEQFAAVTGLSEGDRLNPQAMYQLLNAKHGLFKNAPDGARKVWLINQVDHFSDRAYATEFIDSVKLLSPPVHHCVMSSFRNSSNPFVQEAIRITEFNR
ncbi:selenium cofactor biosynthesis protein YqeC [Endozoicomonas elysicola]|uniref:selenium cofactor biosynthesis protein YqeC n=1 Tax=Endozoicomonas elysicola TaxID=305900 RepID=UPI000382247B|nr:selenium cofactor biosynthesis protein YqeC [Endozoicomonas elysicola]